VENWDYEFNKEMKINAEYCEVVFTVCGKNSGLARIIPNQNLEYPARKPNINRKRYI
jgi:hypothetical protein